MPREDNNGWRTIESAPRDGTLVLLAGINGFSNLRGYGHWLEEDPSAEWSGPGWWGACSGRYGELGPPTHWQPMPEPPHDR